MMELDRWSKLKEIFKVKYLVIHICCVINVLISGSAYIIAMSL